MVILSGCRIIPTVEGPREDLANMADLETRLYWEQQLDLGHAVLTPGIDVEGFLEAGGGDFSHRLISETGGVFHVKVDEGRAARWGEPLSYPTALQWMEHANREMERTLGQMSRLKLANSLLEAECKAWREWFNTGIEDGIVVEWPEGVER